MGCPTASAPGKMHQRQGSDQGVRHAANKWDTCESWGQWDHPDYLGLGSTWGWAQPGAGLNLGLGSTWGWAQPGAGLNLGRAPHRGGPPSPSGRPGAGASTTNPRHSTKSPLSSALVRVRCGESPARRPTQIRCDEPSFPEGIGFRPRFRPLGAERPPAGPTTLTLLALRVFAADISVAKTRNASKVDRGDAWDERDRPPRSADR